MGTGKPTEILSNMNELAGCEQDEEIQLFEKFIHADNTKTLCYPDVPSFLEYVYNRQVVHFCELEKSKEDEFSLELSKLNTYDNVDSLLLGKLNIDLLKLLLTGVDKELDNVLLVFVTKECNFFLNQQYVLLEVVEAVGVVIDVGLGPTGRQVRDVVAFGGR
ncbi:ubiquitin carboxyl-terminal hydrolase 12-like protein isoform X2 [Tanacetum coccineum]